MTGLRLLVRSVLRGRARQRGRQSYEFVPTRVWWVPGGRHVEPALALLIERQERTRSQQPHG